jgi:hypothetical protein
MGCLLDRMNSYIYSVGKKQKSRNRKASWQAFLVPMACGLVLIQGQCGLKLLLGWLLLLAGGLLTSLANTVQVPRQQ